MPCTSQTGETAAKLKQVEVDEDVRLDAPFVLVEDLADREVALQVFEPDELDVVLPEDRRILVGQIGA